MNTKLSELDGYLAEGIRILESERDNLRSEVEALRELLRQASELIQEQDAHLDVDMLPAGCALMRDIKAALSQQVEPAPAQDEPDLTIRARSRHGEVLPVEELNTSAWFDGLPNGTVVELYRRPAHTEQQPVVFWVLFDATGPERFIKKDVSDGTLAFFDSEDEAQRVKRRNPGTDYKRVEYYHAPIAQIEQQPERSEPNKVQVSILPLRRVLNALVNAPHEIRELQVTREPAALFTDNPINVLIAELNAAMDAKEE